jgi:hypothetical protein
LGKGLIFKWQGEWCISQDGLKQQALKLSGR